MNRVCLLWGPNGGAVTVCGVFADYETACDRAEDSNRAEGFTPEGELPRWFVEEWIVQVAS